MLLPSGPVRDSFAFNKYIVEQDEKHVSCTCVSRIAFSSSTVNVCYGAAVVCIIVPGHTPDDIYFRTVDFLEIPVVEPRLRPCSPHAQRLAMYV